MNRYFFYFLVGLLTFTIGLAIALNVYRNSKTDFPKEFRTQTSYQPDAERNLWERPWKVPVQRVQKKEIPAKPYCMDDKILLIWNQLIKDKSFKDWEADSRDSLDCAEMLEIKEIDLNQDNQKEFFLRGKNSNLCSAVGNCAFWIYEKKEKKFKNLLYSTDQWEITELPNQASKTRTNKYSDIVLKGHMTAADTTYEYFRFSGEKYIRNKCLVETPVKYTKDKPKWGFVGCKEFFKNREK